MKPHVHQKTIDQMIDEATVDSNGPNEQEWGWQCALEDNLSFPFTATFLGEPVIVEDVDVDDDIIVAVCHRNKHKARIILTELRFDPTTVSGSEWIEAYRLWKK